VAIMAEEMEAATWVVIWEEIWVAETFSRSL
jgi:hypothetical protein